MFYEQISRSASPLNDTVPVVIQPVAERNQSTTIEACMLLDVHTRRYLDASLLLELTFS